MEALILEEILLAVIEYWRINAFIEIRSVLHDKKIYYIVNELNMILIINLCLHICILMNNYFICCLSTVLNIDYIPLEFCLSNQY
jgi:hypothetical protein